MSDEYAQMVIYNLQEMKEVFGLTQREYTRAVKLARKLGFQTGKPSSVALALVRIVKKDLDNKIIFKKGKTSFATLRLWTFCLCKQLHLRQKYF